MTDPLHDLGNYPSPAEILEADYPDWRIWRARDENGRHGDWIAEHATDRDRVFRAPDIPGLRTLLEKDAARRHAPRNPAPLHAAGSTRS